MPVGQAVSGRYEDTVTVEGTILAQEPMNDRLGTAGDEQNGVPTTETGPWEPGRQVLGAHLGSKESMGRRLGVRSSLNWLFRVNNNV